MTVSKEHENSVIWMSGSYSVKDLLLKRAIIREGLSKLTETTIEIQSKNKAIDLNKLVGQTMCVHMETAEKAERVFTGTCISIENTGFREGYGQYVAEVRPWFWLLTRTQECRIFQEMSTIDIIKKIFSDRSFSDVEYKTSGSYEKRTYCVQYRESDFDFISRLMEEEGLYYFFKNDIDSTAVETLVICDSISAHSAVPEQATIEYQPRDDSDRRREDHISEIALESTLTRGKVTLNDYDFTAPNADREAASQIPKGTHKFNKFEVYDYPGKYRQNMNLGKIQAEVRMEAEAVRNIQWRGASSVRTLRAGHTFTLEEHPDDRANQEYLTTECTHYLKVDTDFTDSDLRHDIKPQNMEFPEEMEGDAYAAVFRAIPKAEQFRAPLNTPWPAIPGLQTATVVGKSGEEIWTDEYGRIKVQFHWDREGKKDEKSSCWVRVVTPWSGKSWGFVAVPRIGQEVVIQFEEGDPDRPICTGMLYKEDRKPAYDLPANATQLGLRTDSSKDENDAKAYNELMFEDKKGNELMRVQAQKDHQMLIKNKSVVTIGQPEMQSEDHDQDGCLSMTVKKHVTETIQEGNHHETIKKGDNIFKIETGSQEIEIKTDKTQTIKGKHTKTITGNDSTTVKQGNMTVKVSMGKIEMEAMQSITFKVGGSTIKMDPASITIKSTMVKVEGDAMAEMKSPMTTVKGDGMLTLKGGVTFIN